MTLREQLQKLIDEKGISICQLGRTADVNDDIIRRFLKNETSMTADNLDKCFKAVRSYKPPADAKPSSGENNLPQQDMDCKENLTQINNKANNA